MKKGLKKILRIGGLAAGSLILLVAAVILLFLLDKPLVKNLAQNYLAKKTGITLRVGSLEYGLFPLRVAVTSLKATYETPIFLMDVLVKRAEAKGSLRKLLKAAAPAFETADIDIAELRVHQKKISETPLDFESISLQIRDLLSNARRVSIKLGRLGISLPGLNVRLEDGSLSFVAGRTAGTTDLVLDAKLIAAATNDRRLGWESCVHADGTLALARTTGIKLRLGLDAPRFIVAGKGGTIPALNIEARADWRTGRNSFSIADLTLDVPGIVAISGSGAADFGSTVSLDLRARGRIDDLRALAATADTLLPQSVRQARVEGKARLEGHLVQAAGERLAAAKLEGSILADGMKLDYSPAAFPIRGQVSGLLKFGGPLSDLRASADLRAAINGISMKELSLKRSFARFQVKASKTAAEITNFEGTLEELTYSLPGKKTLAFGNVPFKGAARLDLNRRSIDVTALEVRLSNLAPLHISGRLDLDPLGVRQGRLDGKGLKIPDLRRSLAALLPADLSAWDFDGALDIGFEAGSLPRQKGVWKFCSDLVLSEAKFNDPSSTLAGQGLRTAIRLKGTLDPARGLLDWNMTGDLAQGESLWRDFYISWNKHPVQAEMSGRLDLASTAIDGLKARVAFPGLGEIHAEAGVHLAAPSSFQLRVGARLGLEALYALVSQAGPGPDSRSRVSGETSGDFEIVEKGEALKVRGRVALGEASVEDSGAGVAIRGIELDLPVNYQSAAATGTPGAGDEAGAPETGGIRVREIVTPFQTFPPLALTLHSSPNTYRIDPFSLDLLGARLEFGEVVLGIDPLTVGFQARTSLSLPGFDVSRLKVGPAGSPLPGHARAEFPVLDITPDMIRTTGSATIDVFGGRVVVHDIAVERPFDAGRAISCDVDLQDLDLKRITDVVPFGAVTGIIRGRVLGLTVTYGQPQSFALSLESVPRKGVAQTFSLKAVNNLTVLSSGQKAPAGSSQLWMKFMKGFHYAKIGIVSTLKNDTFTLNGTIHEKGLEYLVRRPALFGIDVINRMPETKISFKDMMSRLERVGQSDSPEVIK